MKRRLTALLLVLLCLPLTACQKQQNLYSATWFDLFDTVAIVQGYADSQDSWNAQTQAMYSDLQRAGTGEQCSPLQRFITAE